MASPSKATIIYRGGEYLLRSVIEGVVATVDEQPSGCTRVLGANNETLACFAPGVVVAVLMGVTDYDLAFPKAAAQVVS